MKFSTRTTYGLRAMIFLAKVYSKRSVSLPEISEKEKISLSYLERLFAKLKKDKLLISIKGSSGGYRLAENPASISVYKIVKSLEGDIIPFFCLSKQGFLKCSSAKSCGASLVLSKVQKSIISTLKKIKLKDLIK